MLAYAAVAAYKAYNVYDTVNTTIDNFNTLTDQSTSAGEKALVVGGVVASVVGVPKVIQKKSGKLFSKFRNKNKNSTGNNSKTGDNKQQPNGKGNDKNTDKEGESKEQASKGNDDSLKFDTDAEAGMPVNQKSKGTGDGNATKNVGNLTKSQQRAIRGLEDQISAHQKKLADFKANPDAFDNKGFLKNASPELREKIISSRINSLEKQINTFKKDIDAIQSGAKEVLEKL